jgi:hypothetical protein
MTGEVISFRSIGVAGCAPGSAQPYRSVDTVELLLRRGAITKEIAAAADRFRQAFRVAGADRLRARDMTRALGGGGSADLGAAAGQRRKCCFLVASARLPARLSGT